MGGRGARGGEGQAGAATAAAPAATRPFEVIELATGTKSSYPSVGTSAFSPDGEWLLDAATADYDQLAWSAEGSNLTVLRGDKARGKSLRDNIVLAWRGVGTAQMQASTFDPAKASGFPEGMVVGKPVALWITEGVPQLRKGLDPTIIAPPQTKKTIK